MLYSDAKHSQELFDATRGYLRATLHVSLNLQSWNEGQGLPLFLAREFKFRLASLFGRNVLFVIPITNSIQNTAGLMKRLRVIQQHFDGIIVLVLDCLSAYQRGRLIQLAVSFAVPGNQLFIPQLTMDLREHFRFKRDFPNESLAPASQALFLRHLNLRDVENAYASDLAGNLRYSAMSVGRAFEELAASGLACVKVQGRRKHIQFSQAPRDLFEKALPKLTSPVKAKHWFRRPFLPKGFHGSGLPEHLPKGGESALSERSFLSAPSICHFAAGPQDRKSFQVGEFGIKVDQDEDPDFAVDAWRYDPGIVSGGRNVDALSLHLQFRNHPDERVESAAEQILESFNWQSA